MKHSRLSESITEPGWMYCCTPMTDLIMADSWLKSPWHVSHLACCVTQRVPPLRAEADGERYGRNNVGSTNRRQGGPGHRRRKKEAAHPATLVRRLRMLGRNEHRPRGRRCGSFQVRGQGRQCGYGAARGRAAQRWSGRAPRDTQCAYCARYTEDPSLGATASTQLFSSGRGAVL